MDRRFGGRTFFARGFIGVRPDPKGSSSLPTLPRQPPASDASLGGAILSSVTAKEKLKAAVEELTEAEAAVALELIVRRAGPATLDELLANAPVDDEPSTPEDDAAAQAARAEIARGEFIGADALRRELL
jgi:hypothetical protein